MLPTYPVKFKLMLLPIVTSRFDLRFRFIACWRILTSPTMAPAAASSSPYPNLLPRPQPQRFAQAAAEADRHPGVGRRRGDQRPRRCAQLTARRALHPYRLQDQENEEIQNQVKSPATRFFVKVFLKKFAAPGIDAELRKKGGKSVA
ncbi:MAG: hypothetical protein GYB66_00005, partial [Chloroflexi bacterium]|nr:hypothetical protein [Chloroflexota bacterium]